MKNGGNIYAWIAWGMFSLVHKQVQKHYTEGVRQKPKPGWGYGAAKRRGALAVPAEEPETAPAP